MKDNTKPTSNTKPEIQPSTTPERATQSPIAEPHYPQQSKTIWYIGGGIAVLILVAGLFTLVQKLKTTPSSVKRPVMQRPTLTLKPVLLRSKAPGVITNVLTASSLDAQGKALAPASTFAQADKNIYLSLTLDKPKVGSKIEYIRYLNGKYLDSGADKILKPNVMYTSFIWSLKKPGAMHLVGAYKVKVYTNGIFEKETFYTVQ